MLTIAIQNARLLEETRHNAGYLSILNELGRVVTELRDLPSLLEVIYAQVKKHLAVDAFFVGLYDPERNAVTYPIMYDEDVFYKVEPDELTTDSYLYGLIHGEPATLILRTEREREQTPIDYVMIGNTSTNISLPAHRPVKGWRAGHWCDLCTKLYIERLYRG